MSYISKIFTFLRREYVILTLLIVFYVIIFGWLAAMRQVNFETQTWDMGIFTQTIWNITQGNGPVNSIEEIPNHLGVHMSPFLFLLAIPFFIFPSPYCLLLLQSLALGLAAWPLYFLARYVLQKQSFAFIVVISYFLYPSLHSLNLFDFHPVSFLIPFFFAGFYFFETRRFWPAFLFFALAASTQEDSALVIIFVGMYFLLREIFFIRDVSRKSILRQALFLFFGALVYFILSIKVFMPVFGGGLLRLDRYSELGNTFLDILFSPFRNPHVFFSTLVTPGKLFYYFLLFFPLLFLPLFSGLVFLIVVPGIAVNVLTNYAPQFGASLHYDSLLIGPMFLALIYGVRKTLHYVPVLRFYLMIPLLAFSFAAYWGYSLAGPSFLKRQDLFPNPGFDVLRTFVKQTPSHLSVVASTNIVPHLAFRPAVFMFNREAPLGELLIVDTRKTFPFESPDTLQKALLPYRDATVFREIKIDDRFVAYQKLLP